MSAAPKEKTVLDARGDQTAFQNTNTTIVAPNREDEKNFATMAAQFALQGHTLHRTCPGDGAVTYWAERWGLVRHLPTIDTARRFLEQIGGRL